MFLKSWCVEQFVLLCQSNIIFTNVLFNFLAVLQSPGQLASARCVRPLYPRLRLLPAVPSHCHIPWGKEGPPGHLHHIAKRSEKHIHAFIHSGTQGSLQCSVLKEQNPIRIRESTVVSILTAIILNVESVSLFVLIIFSKPHLFFWQVLVTSSLGILVKS